MFIFFCFIYIIVLLKFRTEGLVENLPVPTEKVIARSHSWLVNKAVKVSLILVKGKALGTTICQLSGDSINYWGPVNEIIFFHAYLIFIPFHHKL